MSLKENTQYRSYSNTLMPTINLAAKIGRAQPQTKAVDVSKYQGLSSAAKPPTQQQPNQQLRQQLQQRQQQPQQQQGGLGQVTVPYGGSTRYEKFHPGIDVANKIGTNVPSFTQGKVTEIVGGKVQGNKGYGNYVIITDPQGNRHRYSHLNQSFVKLNQPVRRGSIIGGMGNTGSTYSLHGGTGSHLDYRIQNIYNRYINPSQFIK